MSSSSDDNKNILYTPFDIDIDLNKSLAEYFYETITKNKNKIAQIDTKTSKEQTYNEFLNQSISLAKALTNKGITSEDIIAYCCYNNMEYAVTFVATMFLGARINPIDISASKNEIMHCINLTKPKIIFCDNEIENVIEEAKNVLKLNYDLIIYDESTKNITFNQFLEKYKSEDEFKINTSRNGKDTACISYTSGTSGLSKAAEQTHFGLYYTSITLFRALHENIRGMVFTLPYWISNTSFLVYSMSYGATRIIYRNYDKNTVCQMLQDYKANVTLLTQSIINELIQNPEVCNYNLSSLKYIIYGGSNVGVKQILEIKKIFKNSSILNAYGMTELSGILHTPMKLSSDHLNGNSRFTIGKPCPGIYYKIVDPTTGNILGPYKQGELRIKYIGIINGYLNNSKATEEAFDEDGFFKTGDMAYYDDDQLFYIVDRLKEVFKYKGYHISPVVIETELLTHPSIKDVACIGIPHAQFGDLPMAVVILKENSTITEDELIKYINDRLPDIYNLRGGVKFVTSLPKTTSGKHRRNFLRDLIVKGQI